MQVLLITQFEQSFFRVKAVIDQILIQILMKLFRRCTIVRTLLLINIGYENIPELSFGTSLQ